MTRATLTVIHESRHRRCSPLAAHGTAVLLIGLLAACGSTGTPNASDESPASDGRAKPSDVVEERLWERYLEPSEGPISLPGLARQLEELSEIPRELREPWSWTSIVPGRRLEVRGTAAGGLVIESIDSGSDDRRTILEFDDAERLGGSRSLSPDGGLLLCLIDDGWSVHELGSGRQLMRDLNSIVPGTIDRAPDVLSPMWTPDGDLILQPSPSSLARMNGLTGRTAPVWTAPGDMPVLGFVVAESGDRLLASTRDESGIHLWRVDLQGGPAIELPSLSERYRINLLGSSGPLDLVAVQRSDRHQVYVYDLTRDDAPPQLLIDRTVGYPARMQSGRLLWVSTANGTYDVPRSPRPSGRLEIIALDGTTVAEHDLPADFLWVDLMDRHGDVALHQVGPFDAQANHRIDLRSGALETLRSRPATVVADWVEREDELLAIPHGVDLADDPPIVRPHSQTLPYTWKAHELWHRLGGVVAYEPSVVISSSIDWVGGAPDTFEPLARALAERGLTLRTDAAARLRADVAARLDRE